jgi:hypothetical protein
VLAPEPPELAPEPPELAPPLARAPPELPTLPPIPSLLLAPEATLPESPEDPPVPSKPGGAAASLDELHPWSPSTARAATATAPARTTGIMGFHRARTVPASIVVNSATSPECCAGLCQRGRVWILIHGGAPPVLRAEPAERWGSNDAGAASRRDPRRLQLPWEGTIGGGSVFAFQAESTVFEAPSVAPPPAAAVGSAPQPGRGFRVP